MPDEKLPQRTLKTSFWLALFCTAIFVLRGQYGIAAGLGAGAALGLFSLASLVYVIPRLFRSGNAAAKPALMIVALLKLPIYAVAIYYIVGSKLVNPIAVMAGVGLIPAVLALKVAGYRMLIKTNSPVGDDTCRSNISLSE